MPQGDDHSAVEPEKPKKKPRRVRTAPPEGSDPHPEPEPKRHVSTENDTQLKQDVPPHWG